MELADYAHLSSSLPAHFHRLKGETDDNHRAIEPSSWNILLSASIQGTCSVSLSMIFWVRLQVANRLDLRFVYIWFISFHLNMICLSCFIHFGPRFCHISNTLQGLVKDFEAGCCSRIVWSACQRTGVALFHSSKALSSHCSLARCFRCALRKRVFEHGQLCWSIKMKFKTVCKAVKISHSLCRLTHLLEFYKNDSQAVPVGPWWCHLTLAFQPCGWEPREISVATEIDLEGKHFLPQKKTHVFLCENGRSGFGYPWTGSSKWVLEVTVGSLRLHNGMKCKDETEILVSTCFNVFL